MVRHRSSCSTYDPFSPPNYVTNIPQPNELPQPTIRDTALYRVPIWIYNRAAGRLSKKGSTEEESDIEDDEPASSSSGADDFEVLEKVKTGAQNENGKAVRRNKKSARGR
jgi:hypothetical protein